MSTVAVSMNWELRVVEHLADSDAKVRMLGGRAFRHHLAPHVPDHLLRPPGDLDLFTISANKKIVMQWLEGLGMVPDKEFNLYNGRTRLIYLAGGDKIDIFIDEFSMCHRLELRDRMKSEKVTLPLADLLLTKLQIVELTPKDLHDVSLALATLPLSEEDRPGVLNVRHVGDVLARDWGLWRTCTGNLRRIVDYVRATGWPVPQIQSAEGAVQRLCDWIEQTPKSMGWRARAVVGDRVKWYELPEEP